MYADLDEAARRLNLTEATHVAEIAQLAVLDAALSALFDQAIGRTFDGTAASAVRTIEAPGVSPLLVLPLPVRTVTAIEVGGTWTGSAWTGGTILDAESYRLRFGDTATGWRAIEGLTDWAGAVRVTGTWGDDPGEEAGALVSLAVTTAVIREYRRATVAPDGEINFEEEGVPAPSGLTDPLWRAAVKAFAVRHAELVV